MRDKILNSIIAFSGKVARDTVMLFEEPDRFGYTEAELQTWMQLRRGAKSDNGKVADWHTLYPTSTQQQYTEDLHERVQMWE